MEDKQWERIQVCAYQLEDSSALTEVSDLLLSIHPLPEVSHSTVTLDGHTLRGHSTREGLGFKEP